MCAVFNVHLQTRQVIAAFVERYNRGQLLERHEYQTTVQGAPRTHPKEGMIKAHYCPGISRPIQSCGSNCRVQERE